MFWENESYLKFVSIWTHAKNWSFVVLILRCKERKKKLEVLNIEFKIKKFKINK